MSLLKSPFIYTHKVLANIFGSLMMFSLIIPAVYAGIPPQTAVQGDVYLKSDGTLWETMWNSSLMKMAPVQVGTDRDWVQVTGEDNYFALKANGSLWAWGENLNGELALGHKNPVAAPARVGTQQWKKISYAHDGVGRILAIRSDNTLWGWGRNTWGALGLPADVNNAIYTTPQRISNEAWSDVAAGQISTVGIKADGTLWAFNALLSLYLRSSPSASDLSLASQDIRHIKLGNDTDWEKAASTFGTVMAIKRDGSLWSIGGNRDGMLGVGSTARFSNTLQRVGSDHWTNVTLTGIANVSSVHGVTRSGQLMSWGRGIGTSPVYRQTLAQDVSGDYVIDWSMGKLSRIGTLTTIDVLGTVPSGRVLIANGVQVATSRDVTLNLICYGVNPRCARMQFSNDGVNWSAYEAFAATKTWRLSDVTGEKTVHVRFDDGAGNNAIYRDMIRLHLPDTTGPEGSLQVTSVFRWSSASPNYLLSLSMTCSDVSGCRTMSLSTDGSNWTRLEPYQPFKSWLTRASVPGTVYVRLTDGEGNTSTYSAPTAPVGSSR